MALPKGLCPAVPLNASAVENATYVPSTARRAVVYDRKWIVADGVQQDGDLPRRGGEPSDRAVARDEVAFDGGRLRLEFDRHQAVLAADLQTVAGVEEDRLVRASNLLFE
jgi:hypothetical protein